MLLQAAHPHPLGAFWETIFGRSRSQRMLPRFTAAVLRLCILVHAGAFAAGLWPGHQNGQLPHPFEFMNGPHLESMLTCSI